MLRLATLFPFIFCQARGARVLCPPPTGSGRSEACCSSFAANQAALAPVFVDMPDLLGRPVNGFLGLEAASRRLGRSEERSVGQECVSTCRSRWSPSH